MKPVNAFEIIDLLEESMPSQQLIREAKFERRRCDAYLVAADGRRTAVEVKVTRQDFNRDTTTKREFWWQRAHRAGYLVPAGIIRPDDVPTTHFLWVYEDGVIREAYAGIENPNPLPMPISAFEEQTSFITRTPRNGVTPVRAFRIDDELFDAVIDKARIAGVSNGDLSLTDVIRYVLHQYLETSK